MSKVLKVTPKTLLFDLGLTGIVWILFSLWFMPHVPSDHSSIIMIGGMFTAVPAAGTFWLCLQMFKVTLAHQRKLAREQKR